MSDALQILPIFGFMLIPLFIPLVAAAFGAVLDVVKAPARLAAEPSTKPRAQAHGAHAARPAAATAG